MHPGDSEGAITSINVAPLVDILLVLLIIFMTTAPLIHRRMVKIAVPKVLHSQAETEQSLTVVYDARKKISLSGHNLSQDALARALAAAERSEPDIKVTLAADGALGYGNVMAIIDIIRGAGVKSIGLEVKGK
ncbi:MAG: biopolymer transporter ExbD [Elusimicrobiota bacterium]